MWDENSSSTSRQNSKTVMAPHFWAHQQRTSEDQNDYFTLSDPSMTFQGIYLDTHSDILPTIVFGICSDIYAGIMSDILSGILFVI